MGWLKKNVFGLITLLLACFSFVGMYSVNNYRLDEIEKRIDSDIVNVMKWEQQEKINISIEKKLEQIEKLLRRRRKR